MVSDLTAAGARPCRRKFGSSQSTTGAAISASATLCRAIIFLVFTQASFAAADGKIRANYEVTLAGLTIAYAETLIVMKGETYSFRVNYRISGAGRLLGSATGEAVSSGTHRQGRLFPFTFAIAHQGSHRTQKITLVMDKGAVKTMTIDPPVKPGSWGAQITPEHLKSIVDPLSALFVPAASADEKGEDGLCDRTIPVFDGLRRFDVALARKQTRVAKHSPYVRALTACELRITPIAGEMRGARDSQAVTPNRAQGEIEVTFGAVNVPNMYIPVLLSAKIGHATLHLRLKDLANLE